MSLHPITAFVLLLIAVLLIVLIVKTIGGTC